MSISVGSDPWTTADAERLHRAIYDMPSPHHPQPQPSRFSDWIYRAQHCGKRRSDTKTNRLRRQWRRVEGQFEHRQIDLFMRIHAYMNRQESGCRDWQVLFADNEHHDGRAPFQASKLLVAGEPMRGYPDVVLRDRNTGDIVIIERKTTRVPDEMIPGRGWLNLNAQLWCYGMMDDWEDAPTVYLAGAVWTGSVRRSTGPDSFTSRTMASRQPTVLRSDRVFHEAMATAFEQYGGQVLEGNGS